MPLSRGHVEQKGAPARRRWQRVVSRGLIYH
jgi:hypothetical protein